MDGIRGYLLQLFSTAIICALLVRLMGSRGLLGETVKLLAGILMTITVLNPWVNISFPGLGNITDSISQGASAAVESGKDSAREALIKIIKERSEAYILDKAASLGLRITAQVQLSKDDLPYPERVTLTGAVSPYARQVLAGYIKDNLGIGMEDQQWIT